MRILVRIFCIVGGLWIIVYGIDGLFINQEPRNFTIEEVETNGVGSARFITVTGARSTGEHIEVRATLSTSSNSATVGAILPLFSKARLGENPDNIGSQITAA